MIEYLYVLVDVVVNIYMASRLAAAPAYAKAAQHKPTSAGSAAGAWLIVETYGSGCYRQAQGTTRVWVLPRNFKGLALFNPGTPAADTTLCPNEAPSDGPLQHGRDHPCTAPQHCCMQLGGAT